MSTQLALGEHTWEGEGAPGSLAAREGTPRKAITSACQGAEMAFRSKEYGPK